MTGGQTRIHKFHFPFPYMCWSVRCLLEIICLDTVAFTLCKLSRLLNDSEWCIQYLKGHGTGKVSVAALENVKDELYGEMDLFSNASEEKFQWTSINPPELGNREMMHWKHHQEFC